MTEPLDHILSLQTGDKIPADCVILDNNDVSSNESGLTGEPKDVRKSKNGDCFLLSSCLLTEGEGCKAVVIGIGECERSENRFAKNIQNFLGRQNTYFIHSLFANRNDIAMGQDQS